jgi:hypothetical protein
VDDGGELSVQVDVARLTTATLDGRFAFPLDAMDLEVDSVFSLGKPITYRMIATPLVAGHLDNIRITSEPPRLTVSGES